MLPDSVGLTPADEAEQEPADDPYLALELRDGSSLTRAEVARRATSAEAVRTLVAETAPESLFDWGPVLAEPTLQLNRDEIARLTDVLRTSERGTRSLVVLSGRLLALGDRGSAWKLGEEALAASVPNGWLRHYDGGSRLQALRALGAVDPDKARRVAWEAFAGDVAAGEGFISALGQKLADALPLFVANISINEVWAEIEDHVLALFADLDLPAEPDLTVVPATDSTEAALVELLGDHVTHPALAVASAARRCLGRLLLRGDAATRELARRMLGGGEECVEPALQVLDALSLRDAEAALPFRDLVVPLVGSRNFLVAQTARAIAERLGWPCPLVPTIITGVPPIYELALSDRPALLGATDPAEVLAPFTEILDAFADAVGVSAANLRARAVSLMSDLAPPETWSPEAEERVRSEVHAAGLDLLYRGPRLRVARRAVNHVGGELLQSGLAARGNLPCLSRILRWHDPAMVLAEPSFRPTVIPGLPARQAGRTEERWADDINSGLGVFAAALPDGRVVLAEDTTIRELAWEQPAEIRQSLVVASRKSVIRADDDWSFPLLYNCLIAEYPTVGATGGNFSSVPLALQCCAHGFDSPGAWWLALNPLVARELGWSIDPEGRFRWRDGSGEVMAESIWWVDGPVTLSPPRHGDEVGEGWLVVATPKGWDMIRGWYGQISRHARLTRSWRSDGNAHTRSATQMTRA